MTAHTFDQARAVAYDAVERAAVAGVTVAGKDFEQAQASYVSPAGHRYLIGFAQRTAQHPSGGYDTTPPVVVNLDHEAYMQIRGLLMLMDAGWRGAV